ncbi:2-isopropylmalate synthase [Pseudoalteromonas sp. NBT06-2]|uniref:LeuA family protein n=1 Tax=Pseudoalteromonas sp. NBT06-2 TaxID=2025950 RepID=UPI001482EBAF|nr:2-isopropylmalate synthase [Pseudoalteromonas sp. NBT06-2]
MASKLELNWEQEVENSLFCWNKPQGINKDEHYICDESLRDGLQDPSVTDPEIGQKLEFIEGLEKIGISRVCLGFPASGEQAYQDTLEMCRFIKREGFKIEPYCAARTLTSDIAPVAQIQDKSGVALGVTTFIGISPIRRVVENWCDYFIMEQSREAVSFALNEGLDVNFVTEDTTRSKPENIKALLESVKELGCKRFTLCDTVGQSALSGVDNIVSFVRNLPGFAKGEVKLEWHGHNDRGYSLTNGMQAWMSGCDGVHGTVLGIGERAGNTAIELLVLNRLLESEFCETSKSLVPFIEKCSSWFSRKIDENYPLLGTTVFTTASGVHASAILKSYERGSNKLADLVYSSVPASEFGLEQNVRINKTSGRSNVQFWMNKNNLHMNEDTSASILLHAKSKRQALEDKDIFDFLARNVNVS